MKRLIPPSIGIQGGGQQFGPTGGPGCAKAQEQKIIKIISVGIFLFISMPKLCF